MSGLNLELTQDGAEALKSLLESNLSLPLRGEGDDVLKHRKDGILLYEAFKLAENSKNKTTAK